MKRLLTYCLLTVALFMGVATTFVSRNESVKLDMSQATTNKPLPDQHQSVFSATDLFLSIAAGNEQIRLSHSFQYVTSRLLPSLSNLFRISHSVQLMNSLYYIGYTGFLLKSAYKQLDGYYLYYLRKLLI